MEKMLINTLTLNPALDRIIHIDGFERNVTNRTKQSETVIGGKGTHVSVNLSCLNITNRAFGICHGLAGEMVISLLEEAGVITRFVHQDGAETRTNCLIVEDTGDCTIIADQGVPLRNGEWTALLALMDKEVMPGDQLILSGDFSNCHDFNVYEELFGQFRQRDLKVFVDTSGPSLTRCLAESPYMIKPNVDELSFLCGKDIPVDDAAIMAAIDSLDGYGVPVIAVSMGGNGSLTKAGGVFYRAYPPKVKVANTIGCGDSFLAGFVHGDAAEMEIEDILRTATAVSAATAESSSSVGFDAARARELEERVTVRRL